MGRKFYRNFFAFESAPKSGSAMLIYNTQSFHVLVVSILLLLTCKVQAVASDAPNEILLLQSNEAASPVSRVLSIEDLLGVEDVRQVFFGGDGEILIFELSSYLQGEPGNEGLSETPGMQSKIYVVNIEQGNNVDYLFEQERYNSYTIKSLSPGGRFLVFEEESVEYGRRLGMVELGDSRPVFWDLNPDLSFGSTPWIGSRPVVEIIRDGAVPRLVWRRNQQAFGEAWRVSRTSEYATPSVLASGNYIQTGSRGEHLVLVDPNGIDHQTLGSGSFTFTTSSPDGMAFTTLQRESVELETSQIAKLVVFEFDAAGNSARVEPCDSCDVLPSSLRWSADGRYLAFYAREAGSTWNEASFRIYDRQSQEADVVDLGGYRVQSVISDGGVRGVQSFWVDGALAVRAVRASGAQPLSGRRADWILTSDRGMRNLTAGFTEASPNVIQSSQNALVAHHEGDIWLIDASGEVRNLTETVPMELMPIRSVVEQSRARRCGMLAAHTGLPGTENRAIMFLDMENGLVGQVTGLSEDSIISAISCASRRVAVLERSNQGTSLLVADLVTGTTASVFNFNTHLRDVRLGVPVRIEHMGPEGNQRISWALMPPGWEPGSPPPAAIVETYPGRVFGAEVPSRFGLSLTRFSAQVLAAQGYAVILPTHPARRGVRYDPSDVLADEVLSAVDAAIGQGLVDSERLGVVGGSFGGFAVGTVIGQTDRFKAAVAEAGMYNLLSYHGSFSLRSRLAFEYDGVRPITSWTTPGQFGMGAPPWEDPDGYWLNSPLAHVESISTPVMIIHGDFDFVGMTQAEEFFSALNQLDKDAVFVRYWGESHVIRSPANVRDRYQRILNWFDEHLSPAPVDELCELQAC